MNATPFIVIRNTLIIYWSLIVLFSNEFRSTTAVIETKKDVIFNTDSA